VKNLNENFILVTFLTSFRETHSKYDHDDNYMWKELVFYCHKTIFIMFRHIYKKTFFFTLFLIKIN